MTLNHDPGFTGFWADRIALARAAWTTEVRVSNTGLGEAKSKTHRSIGVWAKTWHWSGRIADVCLHSHVIVEKDEAKIAAAIISRMAVVRDACERARRDFVGVVPCIDHGVSTRDHIALIGSDWHTEVMMRGRDGIHPSEDIPHGIERTGLPAQSGLARALAAVTVNQDVVSFLVEDRIDPYFGRARMMADCENRSWGYRVRIAPRQAHDIKICYKPVESTTMILTETAAMDLVQGAEAALRAEFAHYLPGGVLAGMTDNGLPPGMKTLTEWRIEEEARKAAMSEDLEDGGPEL